ncbi:TetR/AcrR family transcriptional regulator [Halanaerobium hydrogeniformans]|uniref:Transcriptional regulator, TetR family n=1 Tax=Halanaerobium hydrogeniformans TaxID=656519 RepID=E4RMD7_HALHG|nr:TetR/AcrR family transcriptional regulator [Halanaerobium hydrogeniformans]ADQ14468.1 transcriptional regulator, TetR family [Halanaerobium hydrogeniformans]
MSLRNKRKQETREQILKYARHLFSDRGYQQTTVSEIAAQSGIAEGTIYNYFDSKGEILVTIFAEYFPQKSYQFNDIKPGKPEDLVEEIINFLEHHLSIVKKLDKSLLREGFSLQLKYKHENENIFKELDKIDQKIIKEVREFLFELKDKKVIVSDVDLYKFTNICYSIYHYNFSKFVMGPQSDYGNFISELKEEIRFIIREILM